MTFHALLPSRYHVQASQNARSWTYKDLTTAAEREGHGPWPRAARARHRDHLDDDRARHGRPGRRRRCPRPVGRNPRRGRARTHRPRPGGEVRYGHRPPGRRPRLPRVRNQAALERTEADRGGQYRGAGRERAHPPCPAARTWRRWLRPGDRRPGPAADRARGAGPYEGKPRRRATNGRWPPTRPAGRNGSSTRGPRPPSSGRTQAPSCASRRKPSAMGRPRSRNCGRRPRGRRPRTAAAFARYGGPVLSGLAPHQHQLFERTVSRDDCACGRYVHAGDVGGVGGDWMAGCRCRSVVVEHAVRDWRSNEARGR